jgi:hypothetical protein
MSSMRIGVGGRVTICIVTGLALFMVWYAVAADYDYGALAGTYVLAANGVQCTLKLAPDHTFTEEDRQLQQSTDCSGAMASLWRGARIVLKPVHQGFRRGTKRSRRSPWTV